MLLLLSLVPNIFELCASFLAASRNRSTGPDGIPDELFAICCLQMVRLYAPLYTKTALRFETAVSWVGGTLFEFFKSSGLHKLAVNWRAILSSNSAPKRYQKFLRPKVFAGVSEWLAASQHGGRPGVGVDVASHTVKAYLDYRYVLRRSCLLFYIDLKSAFYTVIRPLLYQDDLTKDALAKLVIFLEIPKQCIEPLLEILRARSALSQAGVSPHIQLLLRGIFDICHWQLSGSRRFARPTIGFSPGVGLADLAFTIVYRLYLVVVQSKLIAQGFASQVELRDDAVFPDQGNAHETSNDVTWVDDTVFMVPFDDPCEVITVTRAVAKIAISEHRIRGLTPNMKLGKTTVMPVLLGKGAPEAFKVVFVEHNAEIIITDEYANNYTLHFAMCYKHLGSHKDIKRSMALEINY